MDKRNFNKYLGDRYEKEIRWYDVRSSSNKNWHKGVNIYIIAVSVSIPILTSLLDISQFWTKIAISCVSASIAIAAGINNLFKFHENWINYRTTAETLKKEKSYYLGNIGDYARAKDKEALFIERVEATISRENTLWLTVQKIEKNKKEN